MSQSALDTHLTFGQVYDEDAEGTVLCRVLDDAVRILNVLLSRTPAEMDIPEELRQQLFGSEGSASQLHRVRRPPRVVALTDDTTQDTPQEPPDELDVVEGGEGEEEGKQITTGMAKDWLMEQLRQAQVEQNRQQGAGLIEEQWMEARLQKWLRRERVTLRTHVPESRK